MAIGDDNTVVAADDHSQPPRERIHCDTTKCYKHGCGRPATLRAMLPTVGEVGACCEECRLDIECPFDADDVSALAWWYDDYE